MRLHIDVLGWLHQVWGLFGVLTGVSLLLLGAGTRAALSADTYGLGEQAAVLFLYLVGGALFMAGLAHAVTGWLLRRATGRARHLALGLAVPSIMLVPFGTALGIYTFWVLLNDEARQHFGHTPRAAHPAP